MDKIKSGVNQLISQSYLSEIYTWISDVVSGLTILIAFIITHNWPFSLFFNDNSFKDLNIYTFIFISIFLYVIGVTNNLFIDTTFQLIEKIGLYLKKLNSQKNSSIENISNILIRFSSIPGPLTNTSTEYSPQYKNTLINELNKFFKINGTSNELTDLSKKFIALEDRSIPSKYYYLFSIYKGILTSSLLLMLFSYYRKYYLLLVLFFIVIYGCYIRIRDITLTSIKSSLERSYLLIREKDKSQQK